MSQKIEEARARMSLYTLNSTSSDDVRITPLDGKEKSSKGVDVVDGENMSPRQIAFFLMIVVEE